MNFVQDFETSFLSVLIFDFFFFVENSSFLPIVMESAKKIGLLRNQAKNEEKKMTPA